MFCFISRAVSRMVDIFLDYLSEKERKDKILKYVPHYCQQCELLGICRDEDNNWKCRDGCVIISSRQKK